MLNFSLGAYTTQHNPRIHLLCNARHFLINSKIFNPFSLRQLTGHIATKQLTKKRLLLFAPMINKFIEINTLYNKKFHEIKSENVTFNNFPDFTFELSESLLLTDLDSFLNILGSWAI